MLVHVSLVRRSFASALVACERGPVEAVLAGALAHRQARLGAGVRLITSILMAGK